MEILIGLGFGLGVMIYLVALVLCTLLVMSVAPIQAEAADVLAPVTVVLWLIAAVAIAMLWRQCPAAY